MRKILLFKQQLVVHSGLYGSASKEPPVKTVSAFLQYFNVEFKKLIKSDFEFEIGIHLDEYFFCKIFWKNAGNFFWILLKHLALGEISGIF